jgi:hypothetical protein
VERCEKAINRGIQREVLWAKAQRLLEELEIEAANDDHSVQGGP